MYFFSRLPKSEFRVGSKISKILIMFSPINAGITEEYKIMPSLDDSTSKNYKYAIKQTELAKSGSGSTSSYDYDCLIFVKDTIIRSGKFKTNPINYLFPFFPNYIDYSCSIISQNKEFSLKKIFIRRL